MKKLVFCFWGIVVFMNMNLLAQIKNPVTWQYKVEKTTKGTFNLIFTAKMEDNFHIYGQNQPEGPVSLTFKFTTDKNYLLLGKVKEMSKGHTQYDDVFEAKLTTFSDGAVFIQEIQPVNEKSFSVKGVLNFQSCNDMQCLPPTDKDFSFNIPAGKRQPLIASKTEQNEPSKAVQEINKPADSVKTNDTIIAKNIQQPIVNQSLKNKDEEPKTAWGFFWYSLIWGLAGVLTPCVYPMIPMTVSFFMRGERSRANGIIKGLTFGLSIIGIYTLIGLLVSLSILSSNVGNILSTHWIPNIIFFGLFLAFAASFLGMFEMVLPSSLVNKIDQQAEKGGILGTFFMALTLVIVSFSCTGPIVSKILIESSQGLAIKPIAGMFGYSIAFALPFTLFAIFPTVMKSLPKSGGWLNSVKIMLGFIVLAFSLTFVTAIDSRYHLGILSRDLFIIIWIVLSVLAGLYLLGKIKFAHDSDLPYIGVPRFLLVIVMFSFALYLFTGLLNNPLKPLGWILPAQETSQNINFQGAEQKIQPNILCNTPKYSDFLHLPNGMQGYFDLKEGLSCAKEKNMPVFLDIKGHTCKNCKKMESEVWTDPRIQKLLSEKFIIVALYIDEPKELPEKEWITSSFDKKVKKSIGEINLDYEITHFGANTQPLYAILDVNGNALNGTMGLNLDKEAFLNFLNEGISKFYKK